MDNNNRLEGVNIAVERNNPNSDVFKERTNEESKMPAMSTSNNPDLLNGNTRIVNLNIQTTSENNCSGVEFNSGISPSVNKIFDVNNTASSNADGSEKYNSLGNMSSSSVETVKNNFTVSYKNDLLVNSSNVGAILPPAANQASHSIVNSIASTRSGNSFNGMPPFNAFGTHRAPSTFQIPIIGYEVMEERARFTIYKLRIDDPRTGLSWMVFRRYTDFLRLYSKLKAQHKNLNLPLPEKRRFLNNFDPNFLDDRVRGLQIFVNALVKVLTTDKTVREFFCLDEPPPVGDSEPEAQALFGALEDTVTSLKTQLRQNDDAMKYMRQKIFYLEEKIRSCHTCNPAGAKASLGGSPDSAGSSDCS